MEALKRHQNYVGDNPKSKLLILTDQVYPRIRVTFGGADAVRSPMEIDVDEFVGLKGFKARGKRVATWKVAQVEELEPTRFPEVATDDNTTDEEEVEEEKGSLDPDEGKTPDQVIDEMTGQLSLFPDEDI